MTIPLAIARVRAMEALCTSMAAFLAGQEHWSTAPDDTVILQGTAIDGTGEWRITAGMIRNAAPAPNPKSAGAER